jgi:hypothetical protein
MSALYKKNIDNFLSKFNEKINFIYGGVTENTFEERKTGHINKNRTRFNSSWIISDKAITTINIKNINKLDDYRGLITEVEQYLIDKLNEKYGDKCINNRNKDETIAQRGGAGVQNQNLQLNDAYKLYIFYKLE